MAVIVVGGHARNVGKTSVVAALISAFPQYSWTAIKISSHRHRESEDADGIFEEKDSAGSSDSSRFLAAGAKRSLWVQIGEDNAEQALERLVPIIQAGSFVIIESNYILKFIRPDLYVLVLRRDVEEFKDSAKETLGQADAAVLLNPHSSFPAWNGIPEDAFQNIPVFAVTDLENIPQGLIDLVQSRIGSA
jgi:molybdopterin-guanine dinucleotide biosynthesis protein